MNNEIDSSTLFPEFSSRMTKLTIPNEIAKLKSTPFRCTLKKTLVEFRREKDSAKFYGKPFDGLLKKALDSKLDATNVDWMNVNKRLSRPPDQKKKNTDVCLAYRFGNMYLTKKFFTFGIMRTEQDRCHVYQIGKKPLLFYLPNSSDQHLEKTFKWTDRLKFDCFILEPQSTYKVGENTTYLIITIDRSLFTVDILKKSDLELMNYKDPTEKFFLDPVINKGEILKQSKKRKHESTGEEVNVSHRLQSQQRQSSSGQGAELDIFRHSPSHRNGQLVEHGALRKSSDRYTQTSRNTGQQNTTESANSSTLTETRASEDEPSSYIKRDGLGNKYEFKFIDMNWGENEPRPLGIFPYETRIKGRCYVVVPIKK